MKKIATILLLFISFHCAFPQDTLHHPSRYLHHYEDSVGRLYGPDGGNSIAFFGTEYTVDTPTVIYGVAVTCSLPKDIAIWGMLVQKDRQMGDGHYIVVDSSAKNYYREPDKYYAFPLSDSCDGSTPITYRYCPVYEFFYPNPHLYQKNDTFYVGYKSFNKNCGENYDANCRPFLGAENYSFTPNCSETDHYTLICWNYHLLYGELWDSMPPNWYRYDGYLSCYPILVPPDTNQHGATCEADLACEAEVEGFCLASYYRQQPVFHWLAEPGQHYQLGYAPYDADSAAFRIVDAGQPLFRLPDEDLDSNVMYVARIRTSCLHQCPDHDTLTWGPWSDPALFHTGQHVPDINGQGIRQALAPQRFALSPNPAHNRVELTVPDLAADSYLVTLHSQNGRKISAFRASEQTVSLDVSHLPAGLYLITVKADGWSATQRLVVE